VDWGKTELNDINSYQSIVGSLQYAALPTRPDISFVVTAHCWNNCYYFGSYLTAAKRNLQYLKLPSNISLHFGSSSSHWQWLSTHWLHGLGLGQWLCRPEISRWSCLSLQEWSCHMPVSKARWHCYINSQSWIHRLLDRHPCNELAALARPAYSGQRCITAADQLQQWECT